MVHRLVGTALCAACVLSIAACARKEPAVKQSAPPRVTREAFGLTAAQVPVERFTLTTRNGMTAQILTYGGIVSSLRVPDRNGVMGDVVLGFDTMEGYLGTHPYFGALIGRYGNRIARARFTLEGKEYALAANNGPNHLHGGVVGFDKKVWRAEEVPAAEPTVRLRYTSKDGEEGYPGTLETSVLYHLTDKNELQIDYEASTDKPTVVNLTNHAYFNLAGDGDVLGHELTILADQYTPVDKGLIPTGELLPVAGTPFDFRQSVAIGARIAADHEQIRFGGGYDHNYVLRSGGARLAPAARVREPKSGRVMEVDTTEPGVQLYTGNFLDGSITGKGGRKHGKHAALCLETQHFPDSPNKPKFPSAVLRPGERLRSTTVYRFSVE